MDWIDIKVSLPKYGDLVKVKSSVVDEHLVYIFDGCDVCQDWFEPYKGAEMTATKFEANCCFCDDVTHWKKVDLNHE